MLSNLAPKLATHFCEFCDFPCWYSEALRHQSGIPPSSGRAVCSCQCYRAILFVTHHLQNDEVCRLCCFSCTTDSACRNICILSEYNKIPQFSSLTHIVQAKGYSRSSVDMVTSVMQSWAPPFFLGVMDAQRQAVCWGTCSLRHVNAIRPRLRAESSALHSCQEGGSNPQSQRQHLGILKVPTSWRHGNWKIDSYTTVYGWTHMFLLVWQGLSIWTPLLRFINHWQCLSEVNEQTFIQFNESWISILTHLSKKLLEPYIAQVSAMMETER